jgi:nematode chemoreceptor
MLSIYFNNLSTFLKITYIPLIGVMLKPDFVKHSCYKFMIQLATIDMIVLPCNSMITGIQAITGAHFCTNPGFYYVVGAIATCKLNNILQILSTLAGWYGAAVTCILLALNRLFEMCWPELATMLFHGKRIFIWLAIPPFYALWTFTQVPGLYNNKHYAFFFDPFYSSGYEGMMEVS